MAKHPTQRAPSRNRTFRRVKLLNELLPLLDKKITVFLTGCRDLNEELWRALDRCKNRLADVTYCACEDCVRARLCLEVNARAAEEVLLEERAFLEKHGERPAGAPPSTLPQ